jgi:putative heme-binding domain-containing protein
MIWIVVLLAQAAVPPQIERGETLFFDATKGCAACHALKGRGTAVGPDLRTLGRLAPPAIASAIRATATAYVQTVKPKDGPKFSAMPVTQDDTTVQVYDLSKTPPELRKFNRSDVTISNHDGAWKHPPATAGYTKEQLADIVAYVRYAASGSRKTVDPSEVQ